MPRPLLLVLAFTIAIPLSAQLPRTHDSAGVHIIETASWSTGVKPFTIGTTAKYDIGGLRDNPDEEFNSRNGYLHAIPLASGGMAVLDMTRVQYFDATGKRVRSVGRAGGGPGDFGMVTAACRTRGDTLVVYDNRNRRVAIVSPGGVIVGTVPMAIEYAGGNFCFDDGSFVMTQVATDANGARRVVLNRHTTDGKSTPVASFAGAPLDMTYYAEPGVAVQGNFVFAGNTVRNEVMMFAANGTLTKIFRSTDPVESISLAQRTKEAESTIPSNVPAAERAQRVQEELSRSSRVTWPTFLQLAADPAGRFWVRLWPRPDGPHESWVAIDAGGHVVGKVVMPVVEHGRSPWVEAFGANDIVLGRADGDGAVHFSVYPLIAPL